ncbi:hypothetical protein CKA32_000163 [Geitlerinema sp. FC II]|nr:hypothetical protein CKA32_000163 [Geitlerinema sp. FC II]
MVFVGALCVKYNAPTGFMAIASLKGGVIKKFGSKTPPV